MTEAPFSMKLVAAGLVPDAVVRWKIRGLLAERLRAEEARDKIALAEELDASPIAINTAEANAQHYEVPPRFFELVLGKRLKYSSALFENADSLDDAEERMLELYVERGKMSDCQRILDLGCGWGSLSIYLAQRFPNARILGVSNSRDQKAFIEARRIPNLEIRTADMNAFDPGATFDRIVSIEMLEHMRNYRKLFGRIASWLEPEGLFFVHVFTHREFAYPFEVKDESDWMAKFFFTGGMMPSHALLPSFRDDLTCVRDWKVNGANYARTAEAWLANMDRHRAEVLELLRDVHGPDAPLRFAMWRVFFMACAELWGYRGGEEWGVSHYLFRKRGAADE
ncbi:MAG: cyclopropane-fatty-acyl-phospholipid [Planctomycetota bacterium]|nr:MAG: cyclopropane-fatty-acyl-phospholipid [Planctomycetota bacterium]